MSETVLPDYGYTVNGYRVECIRVVHVTLIFKITFSPRIISSSESEAHGPVSYHILQNDFRRGLLCSYKSVMPVLQHYLTNIELVE